MDQHTFWWTNLNITLVAADSDEPNVYVVQYEDGSWYNLFCRDGKYRWHPIKPYNNQAPLMAGDTVEYSWY